LFQAGFVSVCLDTADKILLFILEIVKIFMMLVATIYDTCLPRLQKFVNKRSLINSFREGTSANTVFCCNIFSGEVIFPQNLYEVTSRGMFFKSHLQWPVSP